MTHAIEKDIAAPTNAYEAVAGPQRLGMLMRIRIELRKLVDTRSSRAILLTTFVTMVIFGGGIQLLTGKPDEFSSLIQHAAVPLIYLFPAVGLLTAAGEWQHGTASWTYCLDPHRSAVLLAKHGAALLMSFAGVILMVLVCLVLGPLSGTALPGVEQAFPVVGRTVLSVVAMTLLGIGLGSALLQPVLGLAIFLIAPQLLPQLIALIPAISGLAPYVNINGVLIGILLGQHHGELMQRLSALVLWIVVPVLIGFWRNSRRSA